ncbi:MAG: hypothetical protein J6X06_05260 [Elusimicrobiaceae bacterium]|nr:hypothetical protein [Elusimicrobiaceae bacterium]
MKKLMLLGFSFVAISLQAAPVFDDLDRFQIPDEPEPVKEAPAPKPAPKPVEDNRPEIVIRMGDGVVSAPAPVKSEASEFAVLHRSAAQLERNLSGKSRFYVLFNANTSAVSDQVLTARDGKQYAVVRFGPQDQNYRLFVFNARGDQPLLAVAENMADKLRIYKKYELDLGITEADFKKAYPQVEPGEVTALDKSVYQTYEFAPDFFVLFAQEKPVRRFTDQTEFTDFVNQLQGIEPKVETPTQQKEELPQEPTKRSFKEIVASGTIYERINAAAASMGTGPAGMRGSPKGRKFSGPTGRPSKAGASRSSGSSRTSNFSQRAGSVRSAGSSRPTGASRSTGTSRSAGSSRPTNTGRARSRR